MRKTILTAAAIAAFGLAGATSAQAAPVMTPLSDALDNVNLMHSVGYPDDWVIWLPEPPPAGWLWGWTCPANVDQQICQDFWFTFDY